MQMEKIYYEIDEFNKYLPQVQFSDIRLIVKNLSVPKKIFYSLIIVECLVLICAAIVPKEGKILPIDENSVEAYTLLKRSPTGRELIKRVKRTTGGNFVFLMLGNTDRDELFDYSGEVVKALTRTEFRYFGNMYVPRNMTIITNRDVIGVDPEEMVKSLAFELENVLHAHRNPYNTFGEDSPLASVTRERVIRELGL
jgi:hypothetical protein